MTQAKKVAKLPKTFEPKFWERMDGRVSVAKEIRRRLETLRADAGADASMQRDLLCQRAVFLAVLLESQECEALESGTLDTGGYVQACNALQGLLKALGLDKKVKQTADLRTYLEERGG